MGVSIYMHICTHTLHFYIHIYAYIYPRTPTHHTNLHLHTYTYLYVHVLVAPIPVLGVLIDFHAAQGAISQFGLCGQVKVSA